MGSASAALTNSSPNATRSRVSGRDREDDQRRHRDDRQQPERAQEDRSRVHARRDPPRRLREQVQPDPDRDPDDELGRHDRGGVGAGIRGRHLALGHDHVDVLQRREQQEPDDRRPARDHERPQLVRARLDDRTVVRRGAAVDHLRERDGRRRHRQRRPEVRAHDAGPEHDEQASGDEPPDRLGHDRPADGRVRADALQDAALEGEQQPQHAGGRHACGGPRLLAHAHEGGDPLAHERRGDRDADEHDEQRPRPRAQGLCRRRRAAEAAQRGVARDGDLQRRSRDREDRERRHERGQRAVVLVAQQAREDHRHHDGDGVGRQRRDGQASPPWPSRCRRCAAAATARRQRRWSIPTHSLESTS